MKFATYKKPWVVGVVCLGLVVGGVMCLRPTKKPATDKAVPNSAVNTPSIHHVTPIILPVVSYVSVYDAKLTPDELVATKRQIEQLQKTGSTSGGIFTTEFKQATHAKMTYRFGRRQKLAFKAVKLSHILPDGFVLTGRQYEGQMTAQGFEGMYRLFENPATKARLEITETKIKTETPLILIQELFNESIYDTPIRLETLTDKKGMVYYHAQLVLADKYVSMTSKGMDKETFVGLLTQLIRS